MKSALDEAFKAYKLGDVPIGAVLVIDGDIIGANANSQSTSRDYYSHAESLLIGRHASEIKIAHKEEKHISLYTTLEPCFMCFGTAVHNRINEIVYACPDPVAGVTKMNPPTEFYEKRWPTVRGGILRDEGYRLFFDYIKQRQDDWQRCIEAFEEMRKKW